MTRKKKYLVTGCAGFIGFHLCQRLLKNKNYIISGIDDINNYYDQKLKKDRIEILNKKNEGFNFYKLDISNKKLLYKNFKSNKYDIVIHLAAQAGVRYSVTNPDIYIKSNIIGFYNILSCCKDFKVKHLIFASSSSVYGSQSTMPLYETNDTSHPISLYAATKKSNEVMAHSFSNIYKLPTTGIRMFTVYGPYGRPDMALNIFVDRIKKNKVIYLNNFGSHTRDFTYIDDVIDSILKLINKSKKKGVPFDVVNIGSNKPKELKYFLSLIEKHLNKKGRVKYKSLQQGDVKDTHASLKKLNTKINYKPKTSLDDGIKKFIDWHNEYY